MPLSDIYRNRERIAEQLGAAMMWSTRERKQVIDAIRSRAKCYAGLLGTMRAGHKGYADQFEVPKLFPGRMGKAARWGVPLGEEKLVKPWLERCPRLIFASDMGDALSHGVPFFFLEREIIQNVISQAGCRHIWLWVTKRPERMARFSEWLGNRGIVWPETLVPMTTITSMKVSGRLDAVTQHIEQVQRPFVRTAFWAIGSGPRWCCLDTSRSTKASLVPSNESFSEGTTVGTTQVVPYRGKTFNAAANCSEVNLPS
jgi:hypothetical protein